MAPLRTGRGQVLRGILPILLGTNLHFGPAVRLTEGSRRYRLAAYVRKIVLA